MLMNRSPRSIALVAAVSAIALLSAACTVNQTGGSSGTGTDTDGGSGAPGQASAPPGSVPADLVGTWTGARAATTERMVFNADGSGSWTSSNVTESSGGCLSFVETKRAGNVVITESTITVYATSVVESVQRCAPPTADENKPAATEDLQWHRPDDGDPDTILVVDSACAAKYPGQESCNTVGCPIGLYCTSRLKRE